MKDDLLTEKQEIKCVIIISETQSVEIYFLGRSPFKRVSQRFAFNPNLC